MGEVRLPELGENIDRVDVAAVLVSPGDTVRQDQPIIEVETEKASLEVPSTCEGRIAEVRVRQGDKLSVGDVILVVESTPGAERALEQASAAPPPEAPEASVVAFPSKPRPADREIGNPLPAAPSVRALARQLGVDLGQVHGSGKAGRITRDDVKAHAKGLISGIAPSSVVGYAVPPPLPDFSAWGEVEREPLSAVRRSTARNMVRAWTTVPHVTQFDRSDITQLEAMRKRFNQRPEAEGHKLTMTAIVLKLVGSALGRFPQFNASLDIANEQVVYKRYVNVGVAVDTDRGLLVPVIRDVKRKRLLQIADELSDAASRARERKIKPDEMQGATFTVSNLGGLGTTYFSPIVNWPEVAVLGVGRAEIQAVHEDGQFAPRLILPLSLSYDHRLIDGADAARFLRWLSEALEQPLLLLLDTPTE